MTPTYNKGIGSHCEHGTRNDLPGYEPACCVQALRDAWIRESHEICQTLGRALGYPRYADDPKNFPDAAGSDDVCVGEHVPLSLAAEAARVLRTARALDSEVARIRLELLESKKRAQRGGQ